MKEIRLGDVEMEMPEDIENANREEEMIGDAMHWLSQAKHSPSAPEMSQQLADGLVMLFDRLRLECDSMRQQIDQSSADLAKESSAAGPGVDVLSEENMRLKDLLVFYLRGKNGS